MLKSFELLPMMEKDYILQEIRRTAAANGGVPCGWRRFLSETGIRPSDWVGIYWARWSDAVGEAGFAPNQLTQAYEKSDLLDAFATLTLDLGRLPTSADLRLRARNDPGFPSEKTFRKLGSKLELVAQLVKHCHGRAGYDDVVRSCEEFTPRKRGHPGESEATTDVAIGFIYLMKSGRSYKIGRSNSVGRREYELGIQLPEPLTAVHAIRTDDPPGIEAYWHNRFASKRKNGEWFELTAADVKAFKRRKFM